MSGSSAVTSRAKSQKPVILLDVDGIINIKNDRWYYLDKNYPQQLWTDACEGGGITYSPTVANKINAWSELAEIRWLTSWGERAPMHLAPALGLKAFPFLPYVNNGKPPSKQHFAQQVADEIGPDRLLIWLDDDLHGWLPRRSEDTGKFLLPHCMYKFDYITRTMVMGDCVPTSGEEIILRPNTLCVGPWCGLAPKHLDLVDKYLADPSLAAGKAIYQLDGDHDERFHVEGESLKETEHHSRRDHTVYSDFHEIVSFPIAVMNAHETRE